LTPLDLCPLPSKNDMMCNDASEKAKLIEDLHVKVRKEIEKGGKNIKKKMQIGVRKRLSSNLKIEFGFT